MMVVSRPNETKVEDGGSPKLWSLYAKQRGATPFIDHACIRWIWQLTWHDDLDQLADEVAATCPREKIQNTWSTHMIAHFWPFNFPHLYELFFNMSHFGVGQIKLFDLHTFGLLLVNTRNLAISFLIFWFSKLNLRQQKLLVENTSIEETNRDK